MNTSKKISLVMLAGIVSALASFGAYVLMPYLFERNEFSVNDVDSPVASKSEGVMQTRSEEPRTAGRMTYEATPIEPAREVVGRSEEGGSLIEPGPVDVEPVELEKQIEPGPERTVEERVLAYRAPDGGHSFSKIKALEEADLVAGFARAVGGGEEDEKSKKKQKNKKGSSKPGEAGSDGEEMSVSRSKGIAGVKSKKTLVDARPSVEANVEQENPRGQVVTATGQSPSAVPAPDSRLRSRVGANGRVFVGGGWYSNGAVGNVKGLVGGTQGPTMAQPVRVDSGGTSEISFNAKNRVKGLPEGIESGGPVGFRSVIQSTSNAAIRRGAIVPADSGVTANSSRVEVPITSLDFPAVGGFDGRGNDRRVSSP